VGVSKWQRVTHGSLDHPPDRQAPAPSHEPSARTCDDSHAGRLARGHVRRPPPIVTPRDGTKAPWNSGVSKETYFVFVDGGERMALHVVLEAEHLPGPLDYTLEFRRLH